MEKEIWKHIKGYEGSYMVSNLGNIKSLDRIIEVNTKNGSYKRHIKGTMIKTRVNNKGYVMVDLKMNGNKVTKLLNRIVAETFVENPNHLPQVDHVDGNKENNKSSNLEWVSQSENIRRAHNKGLNKISEESKIKLSNDVKGIAPKDRMKEVIQMDLSDNEIARFESLIAASKAVGIDRASIRDAITGRRGAKTAKGFKWKFA